MIPKVIHYCWFGKNQKSDIIESCINSWREFCPDYKIVEWNEDNFDVNCIPYVKEAYADKKWAFVSDYARLRIVYECGGIYLDTDVLLHSKIDDLLNYECWLASDDVRYLATGLGFGAEKGNSLIKAMMDAYCSYQYPSGTNVILDTKVIERELPSWIKSDRSQVLGDTLLIGMNDYGKYARHLYTYSWGSKEEQEKRKESILADTKLTGIKLFVWKLKCAVRSPSIISFFDKRKGTKLEKIYTLCAYDLLDYGLWHYIKRFIIRK